MSYRRFLPGIWIIYFTMTACGGGALAQEYSSVTGHISVQRDDGRRVTASGEDIDPSSMVAAHVDLPFDTMVRVTRLDTGSSIVIRINDRPVQQSESVLVLSSAAAGRLRIDRPEEVYVRVDPLRPDPIVLLDTRMGGTDRAEVRKASNPGETVSETELTFTLQIGVFSSEQAARTFADSIEKSWISSAQKGTQGQYRVYFRRFEDEKDARLAQQTLRDSGHPSFLRKIAP